jgi:hypothetical protein
VVTWGAKQELLARLAFALPDAWHVPRRHKFTVQMFGSALTILASGPVTPSDDGVDELPIAPAVMREIGCRGSAAEPTQNPL